MDYIVPIFIIVSICREIKQEKAAVFKPFIILLIHAHPFSSSETPHLRRSKQYERINWVKLIINVKTLVL